MAAVAGRRSRRSRSSVRPNPFEVAGGRRKWKLSGIRQVTTAFRKNDGSTGLVTIALPLNGRIFGHRFSWRHRGPLTPYLRGAIVRDADDHRSPTRCDRLGRAMIVLFALYPAWLSRPGWHATLMSRRQAIAPDQPTNNATKGLAQDGRSRRLFALAIEAEWRKHATGVVPAQPKARPEGERPIGMPLAPSNLFPLSLKLNERVPPSFGKSDIKTTRKHEHWLIVLTKLLFWNRPTASTPRRRRAPHQ